MICPTAHTTSSESQREWSASSALSGKGTAARVGVSGRGGVYRARRFSRGLTLLIALLVSSTAASAQPIDPSPDQLRREVDRLVKRNDELNIRLSDQSKQIERLTTEKREFTAQIERLNAEIANLKSQITQLQAAKLAEPPKPSQPTPASAAPTSPSAPIPDDALASPASMLAALKRSHAEGFKDWPHDSKPEAEAYALAAEDWCERLAKVWRGERTWLVRLSDWRSDEFAPPSVLIRLIDPGTGLVIGEPFRREIPRKFIERLDRRQRLVDSGHAPDLPWVARVFVVARPQFNAERNEVGPYDEPAFIGHQVEFAYELQWRSLYLSKAEPARPAPGATSAAPSKGTDAANPR